MKIAPTIALMAATTTGYLIAGDSFGPPQTRLRDRPVLKRRPPLDDLLAGGGTTRGSRLAQNGHRESFVEPL
jgi:hypothetical protein